MSADAKFSAVDQDRVGSIWAESAGTRGGHRRLQTVERCGRPSCSNRVNLQEETQMDGLQKWKVFGSDFLYPSYPRFCSRWLSWMSEHPVSLNPSHDSQGMMKTIREIQDFLLANQTGDTVEEITPQKNLSEKPLLSFWKSDFRHSPLMSIYRLRYQNKKQCDKQSVFWNCIFILQSDNKTHTCCLVPVSGGTWNWLMWHL